MCAILDIQAWGDSSPNHQPTASAWEPRMSRPAEAVRRWTSHHSSPEPRRKQYEVVSGLRVWGRGGVGVAGFVCSDRQLKRTHQHSSWALAFDRQARIFNNMTSSTKIVLTILTKSQTILQLRDKSFKVKNIFSQNSQHGRQTLG